MQRVAEGHQQHIGAGAIDALGKALARRRKLAIPIAHAHDLLAQRSGQGRCGGLAHTRAAAKQKELERLRGLAAEVRNQVGAVEIAGESAAMDQARRQIHADPIVDDAHCRRLHARAQCLALHDEIGIGEEHPARLVRGQRMEQIQREGFLRGRQHREAAQRNHHPLRRCRCTHRCRLHTCWLAMHCRFTTNRKGTQPAILPASVQDRNCRCRPVPYILPRCGPHAIACARCRGSSRRT